MNIIRKLTLAEQQQLVERGCRAESWDSIFVSDDFIVDQLSNARFGGRVEILSGAKIVDSYVANYRIGERSVIDGVSRLECREASSFGCGVRVNSVNENGGRSILLYEGLTAQIAYIWTLHRHRPKMVERFESMVDSLVKAKYSAMGEVGSDCKIIGAKFIREVAIRSSVVIDGASLLECGTIMSNSYVGVDVKMREFMVAEGSKVDTGATLDRCFVGECAIVASAFSAVDSLIFANSHLENGEAAAIFAGPYTVSHHKSSLLIAGMFSFFNAGSGSNQSNHLFKSGAVHQAIHPRGCKFASGAYIMSPAREGAFTMVKGHHTRHHDTIAFPYSYLIDNGGRSFLIPGMNLTSYGTRRDIDKWSARDRRNVFRDVVNFEEFNPYITGSMLNGVNALHSLSEKSSDVDEYMWERVVIRRSHLRKGLDYYNKAIVASIGDMLSRGELTGGDDISVSGSWIDVAGGYFPLSFVDALEDRIEGDLDMSFEDVDRAFVDFAARYDDYAHRWSYDLLGQLLGHKPSAEDVASAIESGRGKVADMNKQIERDRESDFDLSKAIGYGHDSQDEEVRSADYRAVRYI